MKTQIIESQKYEYLNKYTDMFCDKNPKKQLQAGKPC